MKRLELKRKLDEMMELATVKKIETHDGTEANVKYVQELFLRKIVEMDSLLKEGNTEKLSWDELKELMSDEAFEAMFVDVNNHIKSEEAEKATNLTTEQLVKLGARIHSTLVIMELNSVASDSISLIKWTTDTGTYARLAGQLLSAQWDLFQQIQTELDDVSYILLNADEE